MPTTLDLSPENRLAIAEFVYSNATDVLIKQDAITLINVLEKHNLLIGADIWRSRVKEAGEWVVRDLSAILKEKIPQEQGEAIMDEYLKGTTYVQNRARK